MIRYFVLPIALMISSSAFAMMSTLGAENSPTYLNEKLAEARDIIQDFKTKMGAFATTVDKERIKAEIHTYGEPDETKVRFMQFQLPLMQSLKGLEPLGFKFTVQTGAFTASDVVPAIIDPITNELLGFCVIKRKDTINGVTKETYATIGGFHEYGLTYAQNAAKEASEEAELNIPVSTMRLAGLFDDPKRDKRQHVASFAFVGATYDTPKPTVEAHQVLVLSPEEIMAIPKGEWFASDHGDIAQAAIATFKANEADIRVALEAATPRATAEYRAPMAPATATLAKQRAANRMNRHQKKPTNRKAVCKSGRCKLK